MGDSDVRCWGGGRGAEQESIPRDEESRRVATAVRVCRGSENEDAVSVMHAVDAVIAESGLRGLSAKEVVPFLPADSANMTRDRLHDIMRAVGVAADMAIDDPLSGAPTLTDAVSGMREAAEKFESQIGPHVKAVHLVVGFQFVGMYQSFVESVYRMEGRMDTAGGAMIWPERHFLDMSIETRRWYYDAMYHCRKNTGSSWRFAKLARKTLMPKCNFVYAFGLSVLSDANTGTYIVQLLGHLERSQASGSGWWEATFAAAANEDGWADAISKLVPLPDGADVDIAVYERLRARVLVAVKLINQRRMLRVSGRGRSTCRHIYTIIASDMSKAKDEAEIQANATVEGVDGDNRKVSYRGLLEEPNVKRKRRGGLGGGRVKRIYTRSGGLSGSRGDDENDSGVDDSRRREVKRGRTTGSGRGGAEVRAADTVTQRPRNAIESVLGDGGYDTDAGTDGSVCFVLDACTTVGRGNVEHARSTVLGVDSVPVIESDRDGPGLSVKGIVGDVVNGSDGASVLRWEFDCILYDEQDPESDGLARIAVGGGGAIGSVDSTSADDARCGAVCSGASRGGVCLSILRRLVEGGDSAGLAGWVSVVEGVVLMGDGVSSTMEAERAWRSCELETVVSSRDRLVRLAGYGCSDGADAGMSVVGRLNAIRQPDKTGDDGVQRGSLQRLLGFSSFGELRQTMFVGRCSDDQPNAAELAVDSFIGFAESASSSVEIPLCRIETQAAGLVSSWSYNYNSPRTIRVVEQVGSIGKQWMAVFAADVRLLDDESRAGVVSGNCAMLEDVLGDLLRQACVVEFVSDGEAVVVPIGWVVATVAMTDVVVEVRQRYWWDSEGTIVRGWMEGVRLGMIQSRRVEELHMFCLYVRTLLANGGGERSDCTDGVLEEAARCIEWCRGDAVSSNVYCSPSDTLRSVLDDGAVAGEMVDVAGLNAAFESALGVDVDGGYVALELVGSDTNGMERRYDGDDDLVGGYDSDDVGYVAWLDK